MHIKILRTTGTGGTGTAGAGTGTDGVITTADGGGITFTYP